MTSKPDADIPSALHHPAREASMARDGSALQKAIKGDKVTDRQAQGALSQAVDKITNLSKRATRSKEAMAETGAMVIHTAETQGSLFLASMAEGYLGSEKMKVGSVDLRAPVGLLAQGYGLYEAMSGKGAAAGHALALGNGVMGSWLASVAVSAGRTLAEKRDGGASTALGLPAPVTLTPSAVQGLLPPPDPFAEPDLRGPLREVLLTPEGSLEGDDFEGPRRRMARQQMEEPERGARRGRGRGRRREMEDGDRPRRGGRRRRMRRRGRFMRAERPDEQGVESELDDERDPGFDEDTD